MKSGKITAAAAALSLTVLMLAGCSSSGNNISEVSEKTVTSVTESSAQGSPDSGSDEKTYSVVCTIFPGYDWTREIIGSHADHAEITYLLDNGADLHGYQPSAGDMIKISDCDLFIYVGGESDEWAADALRGAKNRDMQVISFLDIIGDDAKETEIKEGMKEEHHSDEHEKETDEHVWLSLKNAEKLCREIESRLDIIDPANTGDYKANLYNYLCSLDNLDREFEEAVKSAPVKTLLFADRFPFRYFTDDYGLDYYAAFDGCSAETEASFDTIVFLADKVDELGLNTVFALENSDRKLAETVTRNSGNKNAEVMILNSVQSVTLKEGSTYLGLMSENLETLKKSFSGLS